MLSESWFCESWFVVVWLSLSNEFVSIGCLVLEPLGWWSCQIFLCEYFKMWFGAREYLPVSKNWRFCFDAFFVSSPWWWGDSSFAWTSSTTEYVRHTQFQKSEKREKWSEKWARGDSIVPVVLQYYRKMRSTSRAYEGSAGPPRWWVLSDRRFPLYQFCFEFEQAHFPTAIRQCGSLNKPESVSVEKDTEKLAPSHSNDQIDSNLPSNRRLK
jgi:hypothetical protein